MKQLFTLILISVLSLLTACQNNSSTDEPIVLNASLDTLSYEIQRISRMEENCKPEKDTCAKIEINYVEFANEDNDTILNKINQQNLDLLRGKKYTNIIAYANGFLRDYAKDKEEIPEMAVWNAEINQSVLFNASDVVSIESDFYNYTGGAHGMYGTVYENYSRQTGNTIELADLFKPNFEEALTEIGEDYFRRDMAIPPQELLENSGYTFKNNEFYLPDNFALKKDGIVFLYTLYEIASYAQGEQAFTIPYGELKPLLKQEGIIN